SWTPASNQAGNHQMTFSVSDGQLTDSETITATVSVSPATNNAPVANAQSVSTNEDTSKAIILTAQDADNDPLTYIILTNPVHGTLSGNAPNLTYTPTANYFGSDSFTFKVNDGRADSNSATVSITVNPVNDAPELNPIGSRSGYTGVLLQFTVSAADVDSSTLTYSATGLPSGASFNASTRGCSWTPAADQTGTYQVTFIVSDGTLSSSETVTITVSPPQFLAPSNLAASALSSTEIKLTWQDNSSDEQSFRIERSNSSSGPFSLAASISANTTTYTNTGLTPSTTYYYRVCAYKSSAVTGYSNTASAATAQFNAPTNLVAAPASSSQINLTWQDNTNDERNFRIEKGSSANGPFTLVASISANTTSYSNTGLSPGVTYYYRVYAYKDTFSSGYSNVASAATLQIPAPTNLTANAASPTQINLSWQDHATDELNYRVERSASAAGPFTLIATLGANSTSYSNTGLTAGTTYYYRVYALKNTIISTYSNTASATP
ncbi:MAG: tandem-95 repeat protein, partial [Candidatus Omnitrophica bacterium]|nr:tandem-95 repeat protein [Candidatus Omnitrophota bacterium]